MKHGETSLPRSAASGHRSDFRLATSDRRFPLLVLGVGFLLWVNAAPAATSGLNPYTGIVERNTFGLKPPTNPADLIKPPPPVFADIMLQGITTILGRKQVLLKVKVPARPPEPARDQALVLSEGQRDGEVEVLEINTVEGSVKLNNNGSPISLNMKENAEKPTPGAAVPGAPGAPPSLPGAVPPPAPAAPQLAPTAELQPFGGSKTIPTRTLRSTPANSAGLGGAQGSTFFPGNVTLTPQQQIAAQRTPEETMALQLLNQAKNEQLIQSGVRMPLIRNPALNNPQRSGTGQE